MLARRNGADGGSGKIDNYTLLWLGGELEVDLRLSSGLGGGEKSKIMTLDLALQFIVGILYCFVAMKGKGGRF